MLHSGILFDAVALPYDLLTRHPIWERHCAQMAAALPAGAQRILDLGCGPGNSTAHLGPGAWGGDYSLAMLHRRLTRRRHASCPVQSTAGDRAPADGEWFARLSEGGAVRDLEVFYNPPTAPRSNPHVTLPEAVRRRTALEAQPRPVRGDAARGDRTARQDRPHPARGGAARDNHGHQRARSDAGRQDDRGHRRQDFHRAGDLSLPFSALTMGVDGRGALKGCEAWVKQIGAMF